jgi:hypothetical protein
VFQISINHQSIATVCDVSRPRLRSTSDQFYFRPQSLHIKTFVSINLDSQTNVQPSVANAIIMSAARDDPDCGWEMSDQDFNIMVDVQQTITRLLARVEATAERDQFSQYRDPLRQTRLDQWIRTGRITKKQKTIPCITID